MKQVLALPKEVQEVVKQTRAIWEQKAVGLIYEHYVDKVRVHRALGDLYNRDEVVADTVQQLAAFPDCRLRGERVVYNLEPKCYVSHWATRVAHNSGHSVLGKPTYKRVCYPVATDFLIYEGRVAEVWEVYDGLLLIKQLGLSLEDALSASARWHSSAPPIHGYEVQRLPTDVAPRVESDDGIASFILGTWHEVWNRRRLDRIIQRYRANYYFLGPSGRRCHTRDGFVAFVLSLLAAFPDARVQIEHIAVLEEGEAAHASVRWRLRGTHDGPGYGFPTGRSVNILGITHHRLQAGRFVEERTVFDELALWAQLHAS